MMMLVYIKSAHLVTLHCYQSSVTATDASGNLGSTSDTVEVIPVPATVDVDPDTLNLQVKGKWITVYIEMSGGYSVMDIDGTTILLNGTVPAYLGKEGWAKAEANSFSGCG